MKQRSLIILLLFSMTVNVTGLGFFSGQQASARAVGDATRAYPGWVRQLPEQRRAELRPILREQNRLNRPERRALRAQHREVQTALLAEPFDLAQLDRALDTLNHQLEDNQRRRKAAFLEVVQALSKAERQLLAFDLNRGERMSSKLRARPDKRG
ncbi:MAG TPA: hypothetical protein DCP57_05680 [Gammaproteobacteria bacterium]|nr:hypothetical protein [Gammaproteobacteria bacterium]